MRRYFTKTVLGAVALFAASGVALFGSIMQSRDDALDAAESSARNLSTILAEQLSYSAQTVEFVLNDVKARVNEIAIRSQGASRAELGSAELTGYLRANLDRLPQADTIVILDRDGYIINTSRPAPWVRTSFADRDYFVHHRTHRDGGLFVSPALASKVSGKRTAYFTRRIEGEDGEFIGVVMIGVQIDSLIQIADITSLLHGQSFLLLKKDGTILARYPDAVDRAGVKLAAKSLWYETVARGGGTFRSNGVFDDTPRVVAVRPLAKYPFVVNAAVSEETALETWRARSVETALGGLLAGICFASLIGALLGQFRKLHLSNLRFDAALNNMSQGLAMYDSSGRLAICNEEWRAMYRLERIQPGASLREVKAEMKANGVYWGDPETFLDTQVDLGGTATVELNDGRVIRISRRKTLDGGWVVTHGDVTDRFRASAELSRLALHDPLTGLANRRGFHERLVAGLRQAIDSGRSFVVLLMDLDRFKWVNDTLGHPVGDALLRELAARLRECVQPGDAVARLGGDEFGLLIESSDYPAEAEKVAARIMQIVSEPFFIEGHRIQIGGSLGIAAGPADATDPDALVKNADLALYQAKSEGRGVYCFYARELGAAARRRHRLELDLRKAVQERQFEVHYQPIVDLRSNRVICFEALVRWRHPERGLVPPAEFIPVLEDSGLITPFGEWVLKQACADAATWPQHISLAVNLSGAQIKAGAVAGQVRAALASSGVAAGRLELEITESILLFDEDAHVATLSDIRALGVRMVMDDFGTGYSSLSYLRRFTFDKVKIDRSFVAGLREGVSGAAVVRAVIDICESAGIETVAEGVETEAHLDMLRDLGCRSAQGFLFSRPVPARDVAGLICGFEAACAAA